MLMPGFKSYINRGDSSLIGYGRNLFLAICRSGGCTVASGVVVVGVGVIVVVVGVCNRSQMRTSKCTCLIFGVRIGLDHG